MRMYICSFVFCVSLRCYLLINRNSLFIKKLAVCLSLSIFFSL